MKRIIFVFVLTVSVFMTSGCGGNELDAMFNRIEDEENVTMVVTMKDLPLFGTIEFQTLIDGEKEAHTGFMTDYYVFTHEGERYRLDEDETGVWRKSPYEETEEDAEDDIEVEDLDASMFEYDDGRYVLMEEYYETVFGDDSLRELEIEILDERMIMYTTTVSDGMTIYTEVEFKEIGTTEVILPDYE